MRGGVLAIFISVAMLFPAMDHAGARPRAFTLWDNDSGQWANPSAEDLAEDVSPSRGLQGSPDILPTFRKLPDAKISPPSRASTTLSPRLPVVVKTGKGSQYSARRVVR